ncbi:lipoyl(octanoyl) transferase LipB [Buchnera aphidicola]|uniref:lipoyl(octanoyl) transferase LipB n=1 Tax=Buchnera aphidicola TaxID=9 RepID=UPI003464991E
MIFKKNTIIIRNLGITYWKNIFDSMNVFTDIRNNNTLDEIWFVEHYPIFTQGQIEYNKKEQYIKKIPVVHSNRGGKITYHAPGQQIVYFLLDLKRLKINIKTLLFLMETVILETLYKFSIYANNKKKNPGIYVKNKKICSIALRIKRGCCLHGFALNISINLKPFTYIHPCGDSNIIMTKMDIYNKNATICTVYKVLIEQIELFFNCHCIVIS